MVFVASRIHIKYFGWIFLEILSWILILLHYNWIIVTWIYRFEFFLKVGVIHSVYSSTGIVLDNTSIKLFIFFEYLFLLLQCLSCKFSRIKSDRFPRLWKRTLRWCPACERISATAKTSYGRRLASFSCTMHPRIGPPAVRNPRSTRTRIGWGVGLKWSSYGFSCRVGSSWGWLLIALKCRGPP